MALKLLAVLLAGAPAAVSAAAAAPPRCSAGDDTCELRDSVLLQTGAKKSAVLERSSTTRLSGLMTMWSDSPTTVVGGSCEYANAAMGGVGAPSATSPYILSKAYCAADDGLYKSGATCGDCFKVSYDGSEATDQGRAGSLVVQIVDSGSAKTFDCQVTAFETITGARTGIFPITYEPVECETAAAYGGVALVLDGMNAWYTKVVFSNYARAVTAARLVVDGASFAMSRVGGATWSASPGGATGAASFEVTLRGGEVKSVDDCFEDWPVATGSVCAEPEPEPESEEEPEPEEGEDGAEPGPDCVKSGDTIILRAHTGKRLTVQGDNVHAKWDHQGAWQKFVIEKFDGDGPLHAGDKVYLTAHTGKRVTVQGTAVHAKWGHKGEWERLVIEEDPPRADKTIHVGDAVFLKAHTGMQVTVQDASVHAKWNHRGGWQRFVVEQKA